jgi:hypothetical protein
MRVTYGHVPVNSRRAYKIASIARHALSAYLEYWIAEYWIALIIPAIILVDIRISKGGLCQKV